MCPSKNGKISHTEGANEHVLKVDACYRPIPTTCSDLDRMVFSVFLRVFLGPVVRADKDNAHMPNCCFSFLSPTSVHVLFSPPELSFGSRDSKQRFAILCRYHGPFEGTKKKARREAPI